jgi:predicted membrane channel-forming protein YqfA (hemolysin III family)
MKLQDPTILFYVLFVWSLIWKGFALWRAARLDQRNWFVAILVLNTIGILEIIYLFRFAKERMKLKELMFWKTK